MPKLKTKADFLDAYFNMGIAEGKLKGTLESSGLVGQNLMRDRDSTLLEEAYIGLQSADLCIKAYSTGYLFEIGVL